MLVRHAVFQFQMLLHFNDISVKQCVLGICYLKINDLNYLLDCFYSLLTSLLASSIDHLCLDLGVSSPNSFTSFSNLTIDFPLILYPFICFVIFFFPYRVWVCMLISWIVSSLIIGFNKYNMVKLTEDPF